jgi:transcriptional regulator with XRE-family HTH domain
MGSPDNTAITGRQIAAARTLIGLGQAELADRSSISVPTLKRMEASKGTAAGLANNVGAVRRALEAAGVEFTNGGQPGVRMKQTPSEKVLDERERAVTAKALAREWTAYCKGHNSMAFASASGDLILVQLQKIGSGEVSNLLHVRVLDRGFEFDGKTFEKEALERLVFREMESHPYRI